MIKFIPAMVTLAVLYFIAAIFVGYYTANRDKLLQKQREEQYKVILINAYLTGYEDAQDVYGKMIKNEFHNHTDLTNYSQTAYDNFCTNTVNKYPLP